MSNTPNKRKYEGIEQRGMLAQGVTGLRANVAQFYQQALSLRRQHEMYTGGDDPVAKGIFDAVYGADGAKDMGAVISQLDNLITELETNHREAIGLPETL